MVSNSLDDVIVKFCNYPKLFILGGQKLYEDAMPMADKLEINWIKVYPCLCKKNYDFHVCYCSLFYITSQKIEKILKSKYECFVSV